MVYGTRTRIEVSPGLRPFHTPWVNIRSLGGDLLAPFCEFSAFLPLTTEFVGSTGELACRDIVAGAHLSILHLNSFRAKPICQKRMRSPSPLASERMRAALRKTFA